jgi:hypothetical protein
MSGFIPGYASINIPLYEANTDIISVDNPSSGVGYPFPIPFYPVELQYTINEPTGVPITNYLVSAVVLVNIVEPIAGNGKAVINCRIGASDTLDESKDLICQVPVNPFITSTLNPLSISFSGLVRTLSSQPLKLYISNSVTSDTTQYEVEEIYVKFKYL